MQAGVDPSCDRHRDSPHTSTLLAEPQKPGCVTSPGDSDPQSRDSAPSPSSPVEEQQGGRGAGLGWAAEL